MMSAVLYGAKDVRIEERSMPALRPDHVLLRVNRAGICGSDVHYFTHGYCAAFVPTRPFILGHELVATVTAVGEGVHQPAIGTRVVANPARACGFCDYCRAGRGNLCPKTIMLGSASTNPPTDGAFAEFLTVHASQCHLVPVEMSDGQAAMIEPLAVALHAVKRAGSVSAKRVLVAGAGPIGLLVAMTARAFGATPVVVSDLEPRRRETALRLWADAVLDPASATAPDQVRELAGEGFDVAFEASGAPRALRQLLDWVRPGGSVVQIGTLGVEDIPLPANQVMVREIQLLGSFRYANVFGEAIRLAASRRLNVDPLVSRVLPLSQASEALSLAAAKQDVLKVQVQIGE